MSDNNEFLVRCLNGAANLYGMLTYDEFLGLYNGYVRAHGASADEEVTPEGLTAFIDGARERFEEAEETGEIVDDIWFGRWRDEEAGTDYVVYEALLRDDDPDGRLRRVRANWEVKNLRAVTEKQLLAYEDPYFGEDCDEVMALADILAPSEEARDMAEIHAAMAQSQMRVNGAAIGEGLMFVCEETNYRPEDEDEYLELVEVLSRIESATRTWNYRGHTQQELVRTGALPKLGEEKIPPFESLFGDDCEGRDYESADEDDFLDIGDPDVTVRRVDDSFMDVFSMSVDDLPPADLTGAFDFELVKEADWQEKMLDDYGRVRKLTQMFVRTFVMAELTPEERKAAYRRLGFDRNEAKNDAFGWTAQNRDIVAGDFASMMDDQNGEPAIRRILNLGFMDERTQKISAYYRNYRYTWLEVLESEAGVGLKCRDLLTGKEIFLMETSMSRNPEVKGMTLCCGIAPMGEVYLSLGAIQPASFESPSVVLKIVLTHLGLPVELPIQLTFAQQAAFAAETIRRLDANGKFGSIHY